jgi:long-subunit acyl-CoA synthetase (AMP-forming)
MSPANIELKLRASSRLIAHAVCIGDRRPYNVALIALDRELCAGHAPDELRSAVEAAVAMANAELSRVEQVKRIAIVDADWLPGGDELTPTMKLKRKPIQQKYASEIEELYR